MIRGNRKFILTLVALVGAIALAFFGKLTNEYVMIAGTCVGAFSMANTYEHKFTKTAP